MSTAFTGYHLNIDPQLLDINHQPSDNSKECAPINTLNGSSSPRNFARDVDQAVCLGNDFSCHESALEDVSSTPTNFIPSRPLLNPLATPFHPHPQLQTPPTYRSSELSNHRALGASQTSPLQSYQYRRLQTIEHTSPQQNEVCNRNELGSPFNPYNGGSSGARAAPPSNSGPYFQYANNEALGQPQAIALFPEENRFAHGLGNGTAMAPSAENVARLPSNQNAFWVMQQWNQATYQGPLAVPSHPQLPPTPVSSGRHRRTGSVALTVNSTQNGTGTYPCNLCPKVFSKRHQLSHHQRWHEKSKICTVCDKPFTAAKDLRRHMKAKHTRDEKHLLCNILGCKYRHIGFHRMDHLKRHNQRVHPGNPWTPPATASNVGG